jgi:hypothetical protein
MARKIKRMASTKEYVRSGNRTLATKWLTKQKPPLAAIPGKKVVETTAKELGISYTQAYVRCFEMANNLKRTTS